MLPDSSSSTFGIKRDQNLSLVNSVIQYVESKSSSESSGDRVSSPDGLISQCSSKSGLSATIELQADLYDMYLTRLTVNPQKISMDTSHPASPYWSDQNGLSQKQMTLGITQTKHVSYTVGLWGNIRAGDVKSMDTFISTFCCDNC